MMCDVLADRMWHIMKVPMQVQFFPVAASKCIDSPPNGDKFFMIRHVVQAAKAKYQRTNSMPFMEQPPEFAASHASSHQGPSGSRGPTNFPPPPQGFGAYQGAGGPYSGTGAQAPFSGGPAGVSPGSYPGSYPGGHAGGFSGGPETAGFGGPGGFQTGQGTGIPQAYHSPGDDNAVSTFLILSCSSLDHLRPAG